MASRRDLDNDKSANYEPVEFNETEITKQQSSTDVVSVNCSAGLPAKVLPPRRSLLPFAISAIGVFIAILGLIILLHYVPGFVPELNSSYIGDDAASCDLIEPSDSKLENAFMINLRSGQHLSFAEAKMVDVVWDLFVGQGGRLLMAWGAYRVFMDGLVSLLETTPVSYEMYASLVFDTTSLLSTWKATKVVIKSGRLRSRVFMFCFCLATFYILAFPTLMGAATGYVNPSKVGYSMSDGNFVVASSTALTNCISLESGELIGETNRTFVSGPQVLVDDISWGQLRVKNSSEIKASYPDYYYWRTCEYDSSLSV